MLQPKKTKHRKMHKGRVRGVATKGNKVSFGEFGLQALDFSRITGRQIEAARIAITRKVKRPEIDSQLVAENIALQLERRVAYRRAMKRSMSSALRLGAIGIKVMVSGRLGGAEIARSEWYREGRVPLSTLRADIDYGFAEAATTYGIIGIKVWIFKGEVIKRKEKIAKGAGNATA